MRFAEIREIFYDIHEILPKSTGSVLLINNQIFEENLVLSDDVFNQTCSNQEIRTKWRLKKETAHHTMRSRGAHF